MTAKKRLGKVVIDIGYVVDLDNEGMVQSAKESLYDDVMNAVKYNELGEWITVIEDSTVKEKDIPSFLLNEEEEEMLDDESKEE